MTPSIDAPSSPRGPQGPGSGGPSEDPRDGALYAGLAELNRHVQQLKQDLARAVLGAEAEVADKPSPAPSPEISPGAPGGGFGPVGDVPVPPAPARTESERRADEIVAAARREADEISAGIRQQVALARQQVATANQETAAARQQARELLALGEQLVASVRGTLGVFEEHGRRAEAGASWSPEPAGGPRAGVYAAPTQSPPAQPTVSAQPAAGPARDEPAASLQDYVQLGPVTLTAGPLSGVASAFVLEQALDHIAAVDRARVKRFLDSSVVIELHVSEPVVLADELQRVLPLPFEVRAASSSNLDIAIASAPGIGAEAGEDSGTAAQR